jgi:hypothetical protein
MCGQAEVVIRPEHEHPLRAPSRAVKHLHLATGGRKNFAPVASAMRFGEFEKTSHPLAEGEPDTTRHKVVKVEIFGRTLLRNDVAVPDLPIAAFAQTDDAPKFLGQRIDSWMFVRKRRRELTPEPVFEVRRQRDCVQRV